MPEELWAAFAAAGFTCWCPQPITVRPAPAGSTAGPFPLPGPATFVTGENPAGMAGAEEDNRGRRAELAAFLERQGLAWHPAVGGDPDGRHHERGALVVGLDLDAAARLGARFGQAAVYVWTSNALHLLACAGDRHEVLGYRAEPGSRLARPPPPTVEG